MCPWITALLLLATIALGALPAAQTYFGLTATEPIIVWGAGVDDNQTLRRQLLRSRNSTNSDLCDLLKLRPRQRRLCRRARGTAAALIEAARIAVLECRFQFMYDRWNCSLGAHAPNLFRKGFRETAFAYSVSSAALVHALARACGRGALERCSCDEAGDARSNREAWRWGGCGDNVKFGLKTSRRFLRSHRWGRDLKARVDHHNSIVGMRVTYCLYRRNRTRFLRRDETDCSVETTAAASHKTASVSAGGTGNEGGYGRS
ncbi:hypothetical protein LSAT2_022276 [Lamellibrachia satsuma]|nr:hypothetical protein LSAT2_022276 [Lamellibrachia satsuma]